MLATPYFQYVTEPGDSCEKKPNTVELAKRQGPGLSWVMFHLPCRHQSFLTAVWNR